MKTLAVILSLLIITCAVHAELTPEQTKALEMMPGSNTPAGQGIGEVKVAPGKMMAPVYPEAKGYALQPQVFPEAKYEFACPPAGKQYMLTPTVEWLIKDPAGKLTYGRWVMTLASSGDVKVDGDHFTCAGGTGTMVVMLFNSNNPHLCWVDTAWVTTGTHRLEDIGPN